MGSSIIEAAQRRTSLAMLESRKKGLAARLAQKRLSKADYNMRVAEIDERKARK